MTVTSGLGEEGGATAAGVGFRDAIRGGTILRVSARNPPRVLHDHRIATSSLTVNSSTVPGLNTT